MKGHPYQIAVGCRIRSTRKAAGYSQEGFANEAGFGRSYFGGVERGDRNVAALSLIRIAMALGVEVGDLFPPIKSLPPEPADL
ncbi:helix-turn-helix transcriptional regulator [Exilibacterium tricleocarpae]|uniref:Helix-turn-helix transcriptional regulator n=1 Tax=Exilibacterium tricleocarpae TaxID=2591008 RepID=A0A545U707_9GAMM|nr:helix-turn-helix transcriptional regulator [Exilibacterium tricleocarpae]TQV85234.1 helix-turn-helix transcriptional regulator [Exilibacterium tricleocarpae]